MPKIQAIKIFHFEFQKCDLKNAGIITLASVIAACFSYWYASPQAMWAVIVTPFLLYAKIGLFPQQRTLSLIFMGLASIFFVGLTAMVNEYPKLILPWFFIITFILSILPRYLLGTNLAGVFILIFCLLAYSMPVHGWDVILEIIVSVGVGVLIVITVNFLFDHAIHKNPLPPPDKSLLLIQRSLRMAFAMTFLLFLCHYLDITNAAWVAFSLIAVEQNNLGTSLKKATQRIAGTLLGIAAGFLLTYFLFNPYPASRVIAFLLVFGLFASIRNNYTFAIFLATILLVDLFYFLSSAQMTFNGFLVDRVLDTVLGIVIGIVSALIIFPKSLLLSIRQGVSHYWSTVMLVLTMGKLKKFDCHYLCDLEQTIQVIEQDIKDFRYEPISFLFRRYHICIKLTALMKKLTTNLKELSKAAEQLPDDWFDLYITTPLIASVDVISSHYKYQTPTFSVEPFCEMDKKIMSVMKHLETYPEAKEMMVAMHQILQLYQKLVKTPRWYLEIT